MLAEFTLTRYRDGAPTETRTLEEWGFDTARMQSAALAGVTAADDWLQCSGAFDIGASLPFEYGDGVELFSVADGIRRYVGTADAPERDGSGPEERASFNFPSPRTWLESDLLKAKPIGEYDAGGTMTGFYYVASPEVPLNVYYDNNVGSGPEKFPITMQAEMQGVLGYAQQHGNAGGMAPFDFDCQGVPAVISTEAGGTSITAATAASTVLAMLPSVCMVCDHSGAAGSHPTFRFVYRKTIDEGTGLPLSPPQFESSWTPAIHTIPNDGTIFKTLKPVVETRAMVRTLRVYYTGKTVVNQAAQTDYSGYYESTVENGSKRTGTVQFNLDAPYNDGANWVDVPIIADLPALPRLLHQGCCAPQVMFNAQTHSDNLHWEWKVADLVNVTGAGPELENAYAHIESVTRDLKSGLVTLNTGGTRARSGPPLNSTRRVTTLAANSSSGGGGGAQYGTNNKGMKDPLPGPGGVGPDGLPALFNAPTLTDDGGDPSVTTTLANAGTNTLDLAFKNLSPLLDSEVPIGTTAGDSSGTWTKTGTRTWKLALTLKYPGIDSVVVNVTTLAPDADASGTGSFADGVLTLDLGIPRGAPGLDGMTWLSDPRPCADGRYVVEISGGGTVAALMPE